MERDCESKLSKLNIEQNACIYHFGASVIHGQRSNILRLHRNNIITAFWTMKESVSKAIKTGLSIPFNMLEVTEIYFEQGNLVGKIENFPQYKIITWFTDEISISCAFPYMLMFY